MSDLWEKDILRRERQEKWDRRFLRLAQEISRWSKDPSTKIGAVVVNDLLEVVGMGYNGFPRGVEDLDERYLDRPTKYNLIVHGEINAILQAGKACRGSTIYVVPSFGLPPLCTDCCKAVIQSGITRVVGYSVQPEDREAAKRWEHLNKIANMMCKEAGVRITEVNP